jgi:hypothetical protein
MPSREWRQPASARCGNPLTTEYRLPRCGGSDRRLKSRNPRVNMQLTLDLWSFDRDPEPSQESSLVRADSQDGFASDRGCDLGLEHLRSCIVSRFV